jgi:hypothetical protein
MIPIMIRTRQRLQALMGIWRWQAQVGWDRVRYPYKTFAVIQNLSPFALIGVTYAEFDKAERSSEFHPRFDHTLTGLWLIIRTIVVNMI